MLVEAQSHVLVLMLPGWCLLHATESRTLLLLCTLQLAGSLRLCLRSGSHVLAKLNTLGQYSVSEALVASAL